jgi:hypothetical protein
LALSLLCLPGCGKPVPQADLDWARERVQTALDAWKKGQRPEALKGLSPPVTFQDEEWKAGSQLLDYKLQDAFAETDRVPRCRVLLTLRDRKGKKVEKEVVYVADKAKQTIGRDPFY